MALMETSVRSLSAAERRLLAAALAWRKRRVKALPKRMLLVGLVLFSGFWGLMVLARRADKRGPAWHQSAGFALAIALPISLWSYLTLRPKLVAEVRLFESALHRDEARVTRIQSNAMVEFEEEEDEGACYGFEIDQDRIVFVSGQDFDASPKFPNTDFSLVDVYADNGRLVTFFVEKYGEKLRPLRKFSANQKARMNVPGRLHVVKGNLRELEEILSGE